MTVTEEYTLPSCETVDFRSGDIAGAYTHLLLSLLQYCSVYKNFDVSLITRRSLASDSKGWLDILKENLHAIPDCEVIHALEGYDMLHRRIYKEPAPADVMSRGYMRAFGTRMKGDRRISETDLFRVVSERLRFRDKTFFGIPLSWHSDTLSRWHEEFCKNGYSCQASKAEALDRGSLLLAYDLFAFEGSGEKAFKTKLAAGCLLWVDSSLDNIDYLLSTLRFIRAAAPYVPVSGEQETALLHRLSCHPRLHPIARRAFAFDCRLNSAFC